MNKATIRNITLILLSALPREQQLLIRDIRNEESVRSVMYSDHLIGEEEHLKWIEHLKTDEYHIVFAIMESPYQPLGMVSVNNIDQFHLKCDWAYYLSPSERGGLGAAIEFYIIDYIFTQLHIEKLNCEVIESNSTVIKLHKKFAFQEEGFRKSNIIKSGHRIGVYFLGLTKEDWESEKKGIYDRYQSVFDKFSITINNNC